MTDSNAFTANQKALWAILQEAHSDDAAKREYRIDTQQEQARQDLLNRIESNPIPGTAIENMNAKNAELQKKVLSRRHREIECGPIKIDDAVLAKKIGAYFGWIDCALIYGVVIENVACLSGYTNDGNRVGEFRWNATDLNSHIFSGTLTIIQD